MTVQTYRREADARRYARELTAAWPENQYHVKPYGFGWAVWVITPAQGVWAGHRPANFATFTAARAPASTGLPPDPTKWERQIRRETPYQRLDTFLRWNGISGYTDQIFSIATGETK